MEKRPNVIRPKLEPMFGSAEKTSHVLMRDYNTLGPTRRAGGINEVGWVVRTESLGSLAVDGVVARALLRRLGQIQLIERQTARPLRRPLRHLAGSKYARRRGILDHKCDALGRVVGVQRQVGRPGLEYPE